MVVYCPKSRVRLEATPQAHPLGANAVVDYYEDGILCERALAILSVAWNVDAPEPHKTVTGLMFSANAEPSHFVESTIRECSNVYRITDLNTLEVWIIALDNNATRTLLYQM